MTNKQQPPSKQQQLKSKQELSTSKQEQPKDKQEHLMSKQQSTSKQQTSKQLEDSVQQEPNKKQYRPVNKQQLQQTINVKLETNKQHSNMTGGQQKHDSISDDYSSVNNNDLDPALVEPIEDNRADTMDAWQSEQVDQEKVHDKSKVNKKINSKALVNGRIDDDVISPVSSEGVTSPDLVHYKDVSDDGHDENDNTEQTTNQPLSSQLTPRKRAISMDVLSPTDRSKAPVFFEQEQTTPTRRRSQTILGEHKRKAPPIPADKSPSTHSKKSISSHSSLGDLRRPVQSSIVTSSGSNTSGMTYHGKFDILGVLRVKLRGVSIPDHTTELIEAPPPSGRSISVGAIAVPEATHGIYCVFTINGGNTSAKSDTCKILPYRPVLWEEDEREKLFFTNHSRQLFILCRKVPLKKKTKSKASNEVCVGASVMKIIEITPTIPQLNMVDYTSTNGLQWYNKSLPLQPKGEIELSVSFEGKSHLYCSLYKETC